MGTTKPIQSLIRGIDLLELLSESPSGMRLNDLAEVMDLKAPTVHNLVKTLASRGLVQKNGSLYSVGSGLLNLAARVQRNHQYTRAEAAVRLLAGLDLEPVVNYTLPTSDRLAVHLRMSPDRPGIVQRPTNHNNSVYGTGTGLAFLAFAPQDQVVLMRQAHPFHEVGIRLWQSLEQLEEHLSACRRRGYAWTPFAEQELVRVAAPVRDKDGVAVAYLGAAVPVDRVRSAADEERIAAALLTAAHEAGGATA